MFKLHAKKIYNMNKIYMTKFASLKKSTQKWSSWKEILNWMIWDFCYSAKACPDLTRLIQTQFSIFIWHLRDIIRTGKQETDETANFRKFHKCFTNKFAAFFVLFCHPIFKREKRNEVTGLMKHGALGKLM